MLELNLSDILQRVLYRVGLYNVTLYLVPTGKFMLQFGAFILMARQLLFDVRGLVYEDNPPPSETTPHSNLARDSLKVS